MTTTQGLWAIWVAIFLVVFLLCIGKYLNNVVEIRRLEVQTNRFIAVEQEKTKRLAVMMEALRLKAEIERAK